MEPCAVAENLKDPRSDFKVLEMFLVGWVHPCHTEEDDESATAQCVEVDCVPIPCVCKGGLETLWADVECRVDL